MILDKNFDYNSEAVSILKKIQLNDYTEMTQYAFSQQGNIEGQRNVISRSAAASKIRERMVKDFINGGVFPPVVLGMVLKRDEIEKIKSLNNPREVEQYFNTILEHYQKEEISIIDGMQRTNIYNKCLVEVEEDREIRVEYWLADNINKLLYRMLVLNTGQVPWNIRRQLEVIYKPTVEKIKFLLNERDPELFHELTFFDVNDGGRRVNAGEFHKNHIIDLYLVYNLRSEKTEVSTQLAEEYKKLDLMDTLDKERELDKFIDILIEMCRLDIKLGSLNFSFQATAEGKFKEGKDLFSSHPVRVGFVAAATQLIIGRKDRERSTEKSAKALEQFKNNINEVVSKLDTNEYSNEDIENFLDLTILNEWVTSLPKSNVGEAERSGFKKAFISLFEEDEGIFGLGEYWKDI